MNGIILIKEQRIKSSQITSLKSTKENSFKKEFKFKYPDADNLTSLFTRPL